MAVNPAIFDEIVSRFGTNCAKWDGMAETMGKDMLALSVADMDLRTPQAVIDKMTEMAQHGIYGYTDPFASYYQAVQRWVDSAYGWSVPEEWIVFCPRIVQAVSLVVQQFTEKGDRILIHTPAYQPIAKTVTLNERLLVESPLLREQGKYVIDFEDMEQRMREGVKLVLLCSPHNPIGRVWTREELERIAELCCRYDALIVSDDIHADFIHEGHEHTIIAKLSEEVAQRSIICTSPGKTFNLASLEIANIIIPNERLRDHFKMSLQQAGIHNPTFFAIPALEVAYTECDDWLISVRGYIDDNIAFTRSFFAEHFPELSIDKPEGTYLLWVDCTALSAKEEELKRWLEQEARINVSWGTSFGPGGEGFIRLNVATPRALLAEALNRMKRTYPLSKV